MTPFPLVPTCVVAGALGLAVGSFLNVVIYRVPREESLLQPGSHCPNCQTAIKSRHNVPVLGWLMLRGRCASCAQPISPRYPLVEATTGALFVLLTVRFGLSAALPAYLYLAAVGVALAMIDWDSNRIPDSIVLPSYLIGALLLMPIGASRDDWATTYRGLFGLIALWAIYFALTFAYPSGMAVGDAKLAGLIGLFLGYAGWNAVFIGVLGGLLLGGVVNSVAYAGAQHRSSTATWRRRLRPTGLNTRTPFGTYLLAAALLALFAAGPITTWYGSLLASA